jgi:uncharacterized protein (DUF305 family)
VKKFISISALSVLFALCNATSASPPHSRYHNHEGKPCFITIMGEHKPVSYDNVFLDKLIKHDKNTIKQAQDILQRADREELKQLAQEFIISHTQEKEKLELLRKELFNK